MKHKSVFRGMKGLLRWSLVARHFMLRNFERLRFATAKIAPLERFLNAVSSPTIKNTTKKPPVKGGFFYGGDEGTRTPDLFDVSEAL